MGQNEHLLDVLVQRSLILILEETKNFKGIQADIRALLRIDC